MTGSLPASFVACLALVTLLAAPRPALVALWAAPRPALKGGTYDRHAPQPGVRPGLPYQPVVGAGLQRQPGVGSGLSHQPGVGSGLQPGIRQQLPQPVEIRVDVSVTNRGRPIEGLSADDFEIEDNGKAQRVRLVPGPVPTRAVVLLDTSGSVVRSKDDLRLAVRAFAQAIGPDDRSAFMTFSQQVVLDVPMSRSRPAIDDVIRTVDAMQPARRTAMREALFAGLTLAQSGDARSVLLLFCDGSDTASWLSEQAVLDTAARLNVVVYVIVPERADIAALAAQSQSRPYPFLRAVADATGGELTSVQSPRLADQFLRILQQFRSRYVLAYAPDPAQIDGRWHELKVKVKKRAVDVRARPGYFAQAPS